MFEKVSQLAARAATSASRRQFLGRLGHGALAAAAALVGLLAASADVEAGSRVCGLNSLSPCIGAPVGTPCTLIDGRMGRCSDSSRPKGSCVCKGPRVRDPRG